MPPQLRVLSLGAGVQSSTLALMAAEGAFGDLPDCAIFADTQWEPEAVYRWLWYLAERLPFPVHVVTHGDLRARTLAGATDGRFLAVPFHTSSGIGRRQCTREFKLSPITKEIRRQLGLRPRQRVGARRVEVWVGISVDEAQRMKPSRWEWIDNRWPLIDAGMSRADCIAWMHKHGHPEPPRSACVACPYKNNQDWRETQARAEDWQHVVALDRLLNRRGEFVHWSRRPIETVDLTEKNRDQLSLFGNECEGMCGT